MTSELVRVGPSGQGSHVYGAGADYIWKRVMSENADWDVVLSTFNQGDIALAKHILDQEDITHVVQGGMLPPMASSTRLLVRKEQAWKAAELLAGLDSGPPAVTDDSHSCPQPLVERGGQGQYVYRLVADRIQWMR